MPLRRTKTAQPSDAPDPREMWRRELSELQAQLADNERLFNMTNDFDLTDYAIHQQNALFMRYRFLLQKIKTHDAARHPSEEAVKT